MMCPPLFGDFEQHEIGKHGYLRSLEMIIPKEPEFQVDFVAIDMLSCICNIRADLINQFRMGKFP